MVRAGRFLQVRTAAVLAAAAVFVALLLGASTAGAQTFQSVYHPNAEARTFSSSSGGWTASTSSQGLCIPFINCPSLSNDFEPSGGVGGPGDGYISTGLSSLLGVAATSSSRWVSPPFTYNGAEGRQPTEVDFSMARRADVEALLDVVGNTAEFAVSLERLAGGAPVGSLEVMPLTTLAGTESWTSTGAVPIDPADLTIGQQYRIVVTSRFQTGVEVLPGGSADYDHVGMRAVRRPVDPGVAPPTVTRPEMEEIALRAIQAPVRVRGNTVRLGLRCSRTSPEPCRFTRLRAKHVRLGGVLTRPPLAVTVRPGTRQAVALRIRNRNALRHLRTARRVSIAYVLRVGNATDRFERRARVRTG